MIEKIFIPTVCRVDNQITYNNLSDELKKKVVFVVQAWERDQYNYDAEYLVLPEWLTLDSENPIANTRKIIYEEGKNMKYAMIDDDITWYRRNAKYWGEEPNMEKSKRVCTDDDLAEMFDLFSSWLDEPDVTVVGCGHIQFPPQESKYVNNKSISSCMWINGKDFAHELEDMNLTKININEDIVFLLSLLTMGYGNRVSDEHCFSNGSIFEKNMDSEIWDRETQENATKSHEEVEKMFPGIYKILRHENGERVKGGFRNFGKTKINWKKAYESSQTVDLTKLKT